MGTESLIHTFTGRHFISNPLYLPTEVGWKLPSQSVTHTHRALAMHLDLWGCHQSPEKQGNHPVQQASHWSPLNWWRKPKLSFVLNPGIVSGESSSEFVYLSSWDLGSNIFAPKQGVSASQHWPLEWTYLLGWVASPSTPSTPVETKGALSGCLGEKLVP
jgi:hypothetical protein